MECKQNGYDFSLLNERAQADGIKLRTSGGAQFNESAKAGSGRQDEAQNAFYSSASYGAQNSGATRGANGLFNKGKTLFKAAFVIFCIVLAESISIYFFKDRLNVNGLYPFVAFSGGFLTFLICTIMYAGGYKPRVRRTKKCGYILTACVLFVIVTVLASMVAVYLKADLRSARELLAYVVIPVAYLFNIVLFSLFYRMFSKTTDAE